MNINIIAGFCSEINNSHIFELIKNRDKTKNHIIIAPDRSQFSLEQRLFDETGEKCFFDVNIISLSRLARSVISNSSRRILTKQSGVALVKKILEDNKDNLRAFNKAISFLGFASSLFETICFYKSCKIAPKDIFVDDSESLANLKQRDIKLVYTEYEKYLQSEYTDSFNQLQLFADNINKDTFKDTIFYFIEFDDFTRIMYGIISKLSKFCDGIYITCTYGKGNNNSNIFGNKVYYDLIDLFKSEGLEYQINKLSNFDNKIKSHLANNLLAYSPHKCDLNCSNINIKSFENIKDEVKYTIADIYSHVLLKNSSFSQYAIVVPSLTEYKSFLIEELKKYNIPYYVDESERLVDNRYIRLLFQICDIVVSSDYKRSDFLTIIKSPLLAFNNDDICNYDNYLCRVGAVSDMCLNWPTHIGEEVKQFVEYIKEWRNRVSENQTFNDYVTLIKEIFDFINVRSVEFNERVIGLEKRLYNQVISKFNNINEDIVNVFGINKISFQMFLDIYKSYYEATNITLPPIASNTLFIADFNVSYVSKIDYLYVLGNNEGVLPKMKLDNGLVTDEEIARLPNADKLSPTIAMLNNRKTFKLFELMFKYSKAITLSYLLNSFDGKMYPNNLINSFVDIGDIKVINQSGVLDVINRNYNSLDINNIVFNNLTPKLVDKNIIEYISNWEVFNNNLNYRKVVSTLYSVASDNIKGIIDNINVSNCWKPLSNQSFFKKGYASISQIETFNMCPYLHFGRYCLRLKEDKESVLKPNDIGTIIHEVLSKIVPIIVSSEIVLDEVQYRARGILDKVLMSDDYIDIVNNKSNNFLIRALYRELDRIILAVYNEITISNFKPKYYEYRFDNVQVEGVMLKGFIDRVDICEDGFRIIDYKTGDNQFKNYNDVVSGKKLQLLMYAKAFAEKSGKVPMGAFYLPLSNAFGDETSYRFNGVMVRSDSNIVNMDRGLAVDSYKSNIINLKTTSTGKIYENSFYKNLCINRDDFEYLLDFAIKQVAKAIANIKNGEISPRPLVDGNKRVCEYCTYKSLCNYGGNNDNVVQVVENMDKLKELGEEDGGI